VPPIVLVLSLGFLLAGVESLAHAPHPLLLPCPTVSTSAPVRIQLSLGRIINATNTSTVCPSVISLKRRRCFSGWLTAAEEIETAGEEERANVGVASETYFPPGPSADHALRTCVSRSESKPY
jgi:hypothetical protein